MSTKTLNKTSFGMYAPLDYETYMKLKKIKAVANLSYIAARRYEKWGRKRIDNRGPEPKKPCPLFYEIKEQKGYWDPHPVAKAIDSGLLRQVFEAYNKAQPVKKPEELQDVPLEFNGMSIHEVYHKCLKWYNEHF